MSCARTPAYNALQKASTLLTRESNLWELCPDDGCAARRFAKENLQAGRRIAQIDLKGSHSGRLHRHECGYKILDLGSCFLKDHDVAIATEN